MTFIVRQEDEFCGYSKRIGGIFATTRFSIYHSGYLSITVILVKNYYL
jgi:hypothetical protein